MLEGFVGHGATVHHVEGTNHCVILSMYVDEDKKVPQAENERDRLSVEVRVYPAGVDEEEEPEPIFEKRYWVHPLQADAMTIDLNTVGVSRDLSLEVLSTVRGLVTFWDRLRQRNSHSLYA